MPYILDKASLEIKNLSKSLGLGASYFSVIWISIVIPICAATISWSFIYEPIVEPITFIIAITILLAVSIILLGVSYILFLWNHTYISSHQVVNRVCLSFISWFYSHNLIWVSIFTGLSVIPVFLYIINFFSIVFSIICLSIALIIFIKSLCIRYPSVAGVCWSWYKIKTEFYPSGYGEIFSICHRLNFCLQEDINGSYLAGKSSEISDFINARQRSEQADSGFILDIEPPTKEMFFYETRCRFKEVVSIFRFILPASAIIALILVLGSDSIQRITKKNWNIESHGTHENAPEKTLLGLHIDEYEFTATQIDDKKSERKEFGQSGNVVKLGDSGEFGGSGKSSNAGESGESDGGGKKPGTGQSGNVVKSGDSSEFGGSGKSSNAGESGESDGEGKEPGAGKSGNVVKLGDSSEFDGSGESGDSGESGESGDSSDSGESDGGGKGPGTGQSGTVKQFPLSGVNTGTTQTTKVKIKPSDDLQDSFLENGSDDTPANITSTQRELNTQKYGTVKAQRAVREGILRAWNVDIITINTPLLMNPNVLAQESLEHNTDFVPEEKSNALVPVWIAPLLPSSE
jgi:hypothetical protein